MAVGEPIHASWLPMTRGNWPLAEASVIRSVSGSTTVSSDIETAEERTGDASAGSLMRSQLNFTAAASSVVPSENFTSGRNLRVHTLASVDVMPRANWATRSYVAESWKNKVSKMATSRGPSVADELLEPLAGSKPAVSADTATTMLPPGTGCLPPVVVDVVACTFSRFVCVFGLATFVVVTVTPFFAVVPVEPDFTVVPDPPDATAVVEVDTS